MCTLYAMFRYRSTWRSFVNEPYSVYRSYLKRGRSHPALNKFASFLSPFLISPFKLLFFVKSIFFGKIFAGKRKNRVVYLLQKMKLLTLLLGFLLFIPVVSYSQYGKRCLSGDCENGHGVLDYGRNVGKYEGEFKNGKKEGFGTMYYADGRKWEGQWKKDAFKGGVTTTVPYHAVKDSLRPAGISDSNPFNDALYRILSTVPSDFAALKGDKIGTEVNGKYAIWKPLVLLPSAQYGIIRQETHECRYYFLENAEKKEAEKKFDEVSHQIQYANPQTWSFKDVSANPAFPYHLKLYKWTIATPATIRLELKQKPTDNTKYDLYMVLTP